MCFLHLIGIILDYGIGCIDDILCRTIILFQINNSGFWVVFFERKNILDISSSPAIYPLPVIPYYTKVTRFTCKRTYHLILEDIRILILIHEKIFKSSVKIFENFIIFEYFPHKKKEIIKIKSITSSHNSCIFFVYIIYNRSKERINRLFIVLRKESISFCF